MSKQKRKDTEAYLCSRCQVNHRYRLRRGGGCAGDLQGKGTSQSSRSSNSRESSVHYKSLLGSNATCQHQKDTTCPPTSRQKMPHKSHETLHITRAKESLEVRQRLVSTALFELDNTSISVHGAWEFDQEAINRANEYEDAVFNPPRVIARSRSETGMRLNMDAEYVLEGYREFCRSISDTL